MALGEALIKACETKPKFDFLYPVDIPIQVLCRLWMCNPSASALSVRSSLSHACTVSVPVSSVIFTSRNRIHHGRQGVHLAQVTGST